MAVPVEGMRGMSDRASSSRLGHNRESQWPLITVHSRLLSRFSNETLLLHTGLRQHKGLVCGKIPQKQRNI